MTEEGLYELLDERGIPYEVYHHEAVMTVAEADVLVPRLAIPTKNLFLTDKRGHFYVVTTDEHTAIDLKRLHKLLGTRRLSFASPEQLQERLGLVQGSVTPFGVLNDETREVLLVFDERLAHERFDAHPMVNTATMFIEMDEVLPLFEEHGTRVVFADLSCAGVE
jgi:Ala-tRNA(Pro) deacylase